LYADTAVGILFQNPTTKPTKHWFGLVTRPARREFLGVIWLDNKARQTKPSNWIFQVYGRPHAALAQQLAEELANTFNVKIKVHLIAEDISYETYLADYFY